MSAAKTFLLLLALGAAAASTTAGALQKPQAIQISAQIYRLSAPIDVDGIKAIGSRQTKASPSTLQVSREEAARVSAGAVKAGAVQVGSPKLRTAIGLQAAISTSSAGDDYKLTVTPENKGSDTITLNFKVQTTVTKGRVRTTRSASGMARVQEGKRLLIIENPRDGQPGLLVVVEAQRTP